MDNPPFGVRDFLGRPIRQHDLIVYPYRERSLMILKKAIVTGFKQSEKGVVICGYNPDSESRRRVQIQNTNRVVVIKE